MKRRTFISFLAVAAASRSQIAAAQHANKPARIGYLSIDLVGADPGLRNNFIEGLRDLGYAEGRNLVIEYRDAQGDPERFHALAAELVALNVDVILAGGGFTRCPGSQASDDDHPHRFPGGW